MLAVSLLVSQLVAPPQSAGTADSLLALVDRQDTAALTTLVGRRPDDARDALATLLSLAASAAPESARGTHLAAAAILARAYAVAWRDSFPMRQVAAFAGWPPERRAAKVVIDSLRRAGIDASQRSGVAAALRLWRESLRRATALGDSAGCAAALGNLGAGFYMAGEPDSANTYLVRARDLATAVGDLRTAGNAVGVLASVSKDRGDLVRARRLYSQARTLRERVGDVGGLAADENNLGLVAQSLGDLTEARRAFESALAINRRYDRARGAATNLTNLANLASLDGDYPRASTLYGEALGISRERGDRVDEASVLHYAGLLELRRGDYPRARATLARALATYEVTGPVTDAVATRRDLAATIAATGDLEGALFELRRAERSAARARAPASLIAALALARADLAVELNTLAEADRQYARADRLARAANDEAGQVAAREGRGLLLLLRQDYDGAIAELQSAARAEAAAGDRRTAASTELLVGYAEQQRGDGAAARRTLSGALSTFRAASDPVGEAATLAVLADAEAEDGRPVAAESLYRSGLVRLDHRLAPDVAWRLHAGLGEVLQSRGALDDAVRELQAAAAEVERMAGTLRLEERRGAFLEDKWSVYARLAVVEHSRGRDAEAFASSERLRAREMLDLLARGRIAQAGGSDSDRAREQDLRRRIGELTRVVVADRGASDLRGPGVSAMPLDAARDALDSAQRAYADLLLEIRERSPDYARLVSGETAGWRDVAARLSSGEALLEYLVSDSTSLAFVVTQRGVNAVDLHVSRHTLATLVDFARVNLERPDDPTARALWRAPLRRLYRYLIEPVEAAGYLSGTRALVIAPHGELHYLPFAALLAPGAAGAREQYLVERYAVTYTPSASLWLRLDVRRDAAANGRVLALAPQVAALPASRDEVEAIRRIYGARATVLLGAAASARALRAAAPQAEIIHLATYGVLNKRNPLFSFVGLAPTDSADGRLEVHDVFGLSLDARLVVLSACQTAAGSGALGDVPAGDDWVGLAQAFLVAGASHVMATLWPVEDRMTARSMERFYAELSAGRSEAEALAETQRAALRVGATAHPFYWAGLTLLGH